MSDYVSPWTYKTDPTGFLGRRVCLSSLSIVFRIEDSPKDPGPHIEYVNPSGLTISVSTTETLTPSREGG